MPFTFCHPAIVLPLNRFGKKWVSLTGLVTGSMSPDFEYFLRMKVYSRFSHTVFGVFYFDLPLAFAATFVFHYAVRTKLIDNLPRLLRSRFERYRDFKWTPYVKEHWAVVICSILLGAFSHLLWDSFTHNDGYFVSKISVLEKGIFIAGYRLPGYKITQHLSSLLGFLFIAGAIYTLPAENIPACRINDRYWFFVLLCAGLIVFSRMLAIGEWNISNLIVGSISGLLLSMIIVPSNRRIVTR